MFVLNFRIGRFCFVFWFRVCFIGEKEEEEGRGGGVCMCSFIRLFVCFGRRRGGFEEDSFSCVFKFLEVDLKLVYNRVFL